MALLRAKCPVQSTCLSYSSSPVHFRLIQYRILPIRGCVPSRRERPTFKLSQSKLQDALPLFLRIRNDRRRWGAAVRRRKTGLHGSTRVVHHSFTELTCMSLRMSTCWDGRFSSSPELRTSAGAPRVSCYPDLPCCCPARPS